MKKIISLILVIAIILLVGCTETTEADTQIDYIQDNTSKKTTIFTIVVDKETGVNYIVTYDYKSGMGITPRLNADGTPYVSKIDK